MRYVPAPPTEDPEDDYLPEGILALPEQRPVRQFLLDIVQTLLIALLLFAVVQALVQNYVVTGRSMEPSVQNGELIIVNKAVYFTVNRDTVDEYLPFIDLPEGEDVFLFHPPQRGEIVVLNSPQESDVNLIKRIIGVPGDVIELDGAGPIRINGTEIEEPWLSPGQRTQGPRRTVLGNTEYFVLGDNRRSSQDSRHWGTIELDDIVGKALFTYWPPQDIGPAAHRTGAFADA